MPKTREQQLEEYFRREIKIVRLTVEENSGPPEDRIAAIISRFPTGPDDVIRWVTSNSGPDYRAS